MNVCLGLRLIPDPKWNPYIQSFAKDAGQMVSSFSRPLGSSCHTLYLLESNQTIVFLILIFTKYNAREPFKVDDFYFFKFLFFTIVHPIKGHSKQGFIVSDCHKDVGRGRGICDEDVQDRYRLILDLKEFRLQRSSKHPLRSLFHKVTVLGKKLSVWNFFLLQRIRME